MTKQKRGMENVFFIDFHNIFRHWFIIEILFKKSKYSSAIQISHYKYLKEEVCQLKYFLFKLHLFLLFITDNLESKLITWRDFNNGILSKLFWAVTVFVAWKKCQLINNRLLWIINCVLRFTFHLPHITWTKKSQILNDIIHQEVTSFSAGRQHHKHQ